MMLFFSVEKIVRWRHCHDPDCDEDNDSHIVSLSVVGDSVHNFIDGMIIAAAFLVNFRLGLTTTLAVIMHEIPQEIGHFGVFFHQGLSLKKSLTLNFVSALFALLGCVLVLLFKNIVDISQYILPLTAGGFIYLASSDLIPELHRHQPVIKHSLLQIFTVVLGFSLMALLLLVE
jgi:zinc and cadmium transporter